MELQEETNKISIIVCSKNKNAHSSFCDNIRDTIGVEYEIVNIDNSENNFSIFSAYNSGWRKSKYPYLCFLHEDIYIHTQDWGMKLINHLQRQQTGIVGLAGGPLVTRIPASWTDHLSRINIIQSDTTKNNYRKQRIKPANHSGDSLPVIFLDGVFLGMRRDLMNTIRFDESFSGFHIYDLDISMQAHIAGYTNFVIYDIVGEHFSRGKRDAFYFKNLIDLFKKWENQLPQIEPNVPVIYSKSVHLIEKWKLYKLLWKLVDRNFSTDEIVTIITYFKKIISPKKEPAKLLILFRIFIIRLLHCPQQIFHKRV